MKAVILPIESPGLLTPLCNWTSDYLIPIVNKPIAEHLLELLLENNVRDIIFILNHLPHDTEDYFKAGERWGCNISYALVKEYEGILPALSHVQQRINDNIICIPVNTVTNIDISSFVRFHNQSPGEITIPEMTNKVMPADIRKSYPFIMSPGVASYLTDYNQNLNVYQMIEHISQIGLKHLIFSSDFDYYTINSLNDYIDVNIDVLQGKIKGINIPGKEIKKGLWIGRQTFIHPEAEIIPPVLIGSNCNIRNSVSVGECSVIGDNVIVDTEADIKKSIIYEKTYIGTNTEIKDSIVRKNFIFNMPGMSNLYVNDDSILGNMDKKLFSEKLNSVFNSLAGLALFLLFSPIIFFLYLINLLFSSKKYLHTEKRYGGYSSKSMTGEAELSVIQQHYFNSKCSFLRKLPGLINVIKGEIKLVGNSTLSQEETNSLTEEWQKVRFEAPAGLIHLWETEKNLTISWEEKIVSESFYASTRTFTGDIIILLKYLFQIKKRKVEDHSETVSA